jgi:hypothetical protein
MGMISTPREDASQLDADYLFHSGVGIIHLRECRIGEEDRPRERATRL